MQTSPAHPPPRLEDDPLDLMGPIQVPAADPPPVDPRVRLVTEIVAFATGVPAPAIIGRQRSNRYAALRHLAMYLYANAFSIPATQTAIAFGRDRTTAQYGFKRVEHAREEPGFDTWVSALEAALAALPHLSEPVAGGRA